MTSNIATPAPARSMHGVRVWTWATLVFFLLIVLDGVVVRTTFSGAGCGDRWPLCNGDFIPHHPHVATIIEFTHRSITGISSMMFLVMIVWTFFATRKKHPARRAAVASGVLLLTEALLGAVLVLRHLVERNISIQRDIAQSIHFTNTMLLLAAVALTAFFLRDANTIPGPQSQMRNLALFTIVALLLTGATGALAALGDTLFPSTSLEAALAADFASTSPLLIRMRWLHPAASVLVTGAALIWGYVLTCAGKKKAAVLLVINIAVQILLGTLDVLLLAPTWLQVLHLLSADIFWISVVTLAAPALFPNATAELNEPI